MLLAALDHGYRSGGDHGPHFIFPLLLLLLLGFLAAKLIRRRRGGEPLRRPHHGSPSQTLADRFARGEIDRDEYEHRKAVLEGADVIPPAPARPMPPTPPAPPTAPVVTPPADALADEAVADTSSVDVPGIELADADDGDDVDDDGSPASDDEQD